MATDDYEISGTTLGSRMKELRKAKGWTQADLARRAKVERSTIQNIEAGRVKRPSTLPHIAAALGVSVDSLVGELTSVDRPSTNVPEHLDREFMLEILERLERLERRSG